MKRHLFLFVFSLVLLLSAGCNRMDSFDPDYPIVDWYPVNLIVTVQDSQGNDLLDPDRVDNYFEGASLVFRGKQYDVQGIEDDPYAAVSTKYYMPHMRVPSRHWSSMSSSMSSAPSSSPNTRK